MYSKEYNYRHSKMDENYRTASIQSRNVRKGGYGEGSRLISSRFAAVLSYLLIDDHHPQQ